MNPDSGHLLADFMTLDEPKRSKYVPVPKQLYNEAQQELGNNPETYVNLKKKTALTAWAADERKKRRAANKIAKASRKRNRKD